MAENNELPFPPTEPSEDDSSRPDEDFVFQFRLEDLDQRDVVYDDPLLELIRGQLADLLDAIVLTWHGERVRVDGFRLIQDPDTQYRIFPEPDASAPGREEDQSG